MRKVSFFYLLFIYFWGIFTPEQHLRFLEFYKKLSTLGLQQENGHNDNQLQLQTLEQEKKYISVRKNCAYNFPVSNINLKLPELCHVYCSVYRTMRRIEKLLPTVMHFS